jgi:hypothetical protein
MMYELPMHPAEMAAWFGRVGVLRWLWIKGALLVEPRKGWNEVLSLSWLRRFGMERLIWAIRQDVSADPSVLLAAAWGGHVAVIRFLVDEVGFGAPAGVDGVTALYVACLGGQAAAVEALLSLGWPLPAWPVPPSSTEVLPLGAAAWSGSLSTVRVLLEHGAGTGVGVSELIPAILRNHTDIVRALASTNEGLDTDEAFSVAVVLGNTTIAAMLRARSEFVWTDPVFRFVTLLSRAEVERVVGLHPVSVSAVRGWGLSAWASRTG